MRRSLGGRGVPVLGGRAAIRGGFGPRPALALAHGTLRGGGVTRVRKAVPGVGGVVALGRLTCVEAIDGVRPCVAHTDAGGMLPGGSRAASAASAVGASAR